MLHAVRDGSESLIHKEKTFRFYRKVQCSHEVGAFVYGKKNPSDDLLTQWARLLSLSDVFSGPELLFRASAVLVSTNLKTFNNTATLTSANASGWMLLEIKVDDIHTADVSVNCVR